MEAFFIAIVFIGAWFMGAESRQVDPVPRVESEIVSTNEKADAQEPSMPICVSGHHQIIQRDLTVPVDPQVNEDVH
ncbi:hypothetical protein [Nitrosococcus oceani]|nr:hypothetical protein [Nitrosococcus oceani]GEM19830.1 hypothetical protein NONS58_12280 [Nitrosococcus oceani]